MRRCFDSLLNSFVINSYFVLCTDCTLYRSYDSDEFPFQVVGGGAGHGASSNQGILGIEDLEDQVTFPCCVIHQLIHISHTFRI